MHSTAFTLDLSPLKRLRLKRELSRRALAAYVGVHWITVWRWEEKGMIPNGRELVALARALQVPIMDLMIVREP